MTIEELHEALDRIQNVGAINKARRRAILRLINEIMAGGNA